MESKITLRKEIKSRRATMDIMSKSQIIIKKIEDMDIFHKAKNVMLYYPTRYEINVLGLMKYDKEFYFPRVNGSELEVCPQCGQFKISKLGIYEPTSIAINPNIIDLIIVPALGIDNTGNRIGYGGGYYDRFLGKYSNIKTLTPIAKEFIYNELPCNDFDIKINYIVSD